jgi:long-chain acyl-CoA synthetase
MEYNLQGILRFLGLYVLIHPFLFIVGIFDFIIGLIIPYKYEDSQLPDKNSTLTYQVDKSDPKSAYRSSTTNELIRIQDKNLNLYKRLAEAVTNYKETLTMGVREIVSIDDEVQPNGKVFKKYNLANSYTWSSLNDFYERINNLSNGLLHIGLKSDQNVVLFAETRPEWIMSAFSCFRIKATVVTLYSTLGVDALSYGINQTNAPFLFTSGEQLPKLQKIIKKIPDISHIVVFDDKLTEKNLSEFKKSCQNSIQVYLISEVEKIGQESEQITNYKQPNLNDLAIIMYTSGSTGNIKNIKITFKLKKI